MDPTQKNKDDVNLKAIWGKTKPTTAETIKSLSDSSVAPTDLSVCTAEVAHQDAALQSYRQQFLVSETFAAAIAANALIDHPIVSLLIAFFGVVMLAGWIHVTYRRAIAVNAWKVKLSGLSDPYKNFYNNEEAQAVGAARLWFGGASPTDRKPRIGILHILFVLVWAVTIALAVILSRIAVSLTG